MSRRALSMALAAAVTISGHSGFELNSTATEERAVSAPVSQESICPDSKVTRIQDECCHLYHALMRKAADELGKSFASEPQKANRWNTYTGLPLKTSSHNRWVTAAGSALDAYYKCKSKKYDAQN